MLKKIHKKGFTQKKFGELIGMHQSEVSRLCKGKKKPTLEQALSIKNILGIPLSYWVDNKIESERNDEE